MDLKQEDMFVWIRLFLFKTGPVVGSINQGNKPDLNFVTECEIEPNLFKGQKQSEFRSVCISLLYAPYSFL
jgi:hypothetical protein